MAVRDSGAGWTACLARLWVLCVLLAAGAAMAAGEPDMTGAVNKAGRQRMLTQRIVKAYAQIGVGVQPQESKAELRDAVRLFDEQLDELGRKAPNATTRAAVARVSQLWKPFRAAALGKVDRKGAEQLVAQEGQILLAANQVTQAFEDAASGSVARLVNVSGRQRMLSQRMAKAYMLQVYGLDKAVLREEMQASQAEFAAALSQLLAAPENSPEITRELEAVLLQWEWFQNAIGLEGATSYRLVVADASEAILQSMERITRMYEELKPG